MGRCAPVLALALADRGGGLEAVHLGHLHVHEHQVERSPGPRPRTRLAAVGSTDVRRCDPCVSSMRTASLLVDRVVLGEQDAQALVRRSRSRCRRAADARAAPRRACRPALAMHAPRSSSDRADRLGQVARRRPARGSARRRRAGPPEVSMTMRQSAAARAPGAAGARRAPKPSISGIMHVEQHELERRAGAGGAPQLQRPPPRSSAATAVGGICQLAEHAPAGCGGWWRCRRRPGRGSAAQPLGQMRGAAGGAASWSTPEARGEVERAALRRARSRPRCGRPSARPAGHEMARPRPVPP